MTGSDFKAWRKERKLTQEQAANIFGRSRRQIINWEKGSAVPQILELACRGYDSASSRVGLNA